ncbi:MAG: PIN domain-containing protein [Bryobacterales bacterium]|nr:PIN domain-containing protein [Bryobacterales bacterium]MDE0625752.1 PIN domain-containing protein [Bryobacterales bacterium]
MIAVDTNVLVYAHRSEMPLHRAARARLTALAESPARWAIPVFCLGEFLRVLTHPKLFNPPHSADEASEALTRLLASPSAMVLCPGTGYPQLLAEAIREGNAVGNLVFDAQIVALCREHGVYRLLTQDRDFDRFGKLRTERLGAE